MRTSILLWSAGSGAVLGLFIDAILLGVALLLGTVVPGLAVERLRHPWATAVTALVLTIIPLIGTVLGYYEGVLKAA